MKPLSTGWKFVIALFSGALLVTAFSPFNLGWIAPIALAGLLGGWRHTKPKQSFLVGLLFGIGFFGFGASWVFVSIHRFGGANVFLASLITGLFILTLSLFPAFLGLLLNRYYKNDSNVKWLLVFPSLWVLFEWIRSFIFTGFPWLLLGYSQTGSSLKGFIPIVGTYGTSFIVAFAAGLLLLIATRLWKTGLICLMALLALWGIGYELTRINWTQPTQQKPISVSLLQGNIPQSVKWNPLNLQLSLDRYQHLTQQNWKSSLIIWPEAALPLPLDEASSYVNKLSKEAKSHHSTIILGVPIQADATSFYNAAIAIGVSSGQYEKQHLVPFGEYVPFEKWLRGLIQFFDLPMSSFITNPNTAKWIKVNNIAIAPFICYEIAYEHLVKAAMPTANLLLVLTNDAWFGHAFANSQHLQIAQMRSIETGRYTLFASNSGITAIISPKGCLTKFIKPFSIGNLQGTAQAMQGKTPWIIIGSWPLITLSLLLLLFGFWHDRKNGKT